MPINAEYAAKTACRDHMLVNTQPLYGSLRGQFYSLCEKAKFWHQCKYSHTIFNTNRVHAIGGRDGRTSYVVRLDYGHGFERYGCYEGWDSGWEVNVPDGSGYPPSKRVGSARVHNLPKALLFEEARTGLKAAGDAPPQYAKVQSLCRAYHDRRACQRQNCKFDHDLVDSGRIEKLARWEGGRNAMDNYDALTVECRVEEGQTTWRITLKEAAFAGLKATDPIARRIPSRPYSYEGGDLLDVVRHMEGIVGLAA